MGPLVMLFSPFWCLGAKGGEVVLLGSLRDLHGLDTSMCFYHFIALVSLLCYLELICILCCELCECKTYGFLLCMVEPTLLCYGYMDVYLHLYAQGMVFISRLNLLCDMSCLCFVSFT